MPQDGSDVKFEPGKQFVSRTITLEPNAIEQIALGSYFISEPTPKFDISTVPDIDDLLGSSLEKSDIPGSSRYACFYVLHNFSDKPCRVTVKRAAEE